MQHCRACALPHAAPHHARLYRLAALHVWLDLRTDEYGHYRPAALLRALPHFARYTPRYPRTDMPRTQAHRAAPFARPATTALQTLVARCLSSCTVWPYFTFLAQQNSSSTFSEPVWPLDRHAHAHRSTRNRCFPHLPPGTPRVAGRPRTPQRRCRNNLTKFSPWFAQYILRAIALPGYGREDARTYRHAAFLARPSPRCPYATYAAHHHHAS